MTEEAAVAPEQEATEEAVAEDVTQEEQPEATEAEPTEARTEDADGPKTRHQRRKEAMERLRRENEELQERLRSVEDRERTLEETSQGSAKPQEGDFETYEEFTAALAGWHALRGLDGRTKQEIEREKAAYQGELQRIEQQRKHEVAQSWDAQVADAKARYADFDQVALNPATPISPQVAQMIASMDAGADVAYQLGRNPAEAHRISSLSPVEAAMELGRLEARLPKPSQQPTTKAPDPVTPVRPKSSPTKDPSKMTMAEYMAARKAGKI